MTCKQLGGACDLKFHANSFEEISEISQKHGKEMFDQRDEAHLQAMGKMKDLMQSPDTMNEWMATKEREFEEQPENE